MLINLKYSDKEFNNGLIHTLAMRGYQFMVKNDTQLLFASTVDGTKAMNDFEGLVPAPDTSLVSPVKPLSDEERTVLEAKNKAAVDFLNQTMLKSGFILSLKSQVQKGLSLTNRQVEVVHNIMRQELGYAPQKEMPMAPQPVASKYKVGDVIAVNRTMATKLGLMIGYGKPFFNFEITRVVSDTYGRVVLDLVTCYKKVSHCACCGLKLTDPQSIAVGIGPICRKRNGVMSMEELDRALGKKELFSVSIRKDMIKGCLEAA